MPKRWPISLAKLFSEPVKHPFTRWPNRWPSQARASRRSQLRFTPIAAGRIEPWIMTSLVRAQGLLEKGENASALELCHGELSQEEGILPRPGRHDFFHRAVSLFTRHRDFEAATSLCNRMVEEGYVMSKKTYMVMMRGMQHHTAQQVKEVRDAILQGPTQMDDLAFKSILDSMVLCRYPAEDLEAAVDAYAASQPPDWVPPISVFGTIIHAHSIAGHLDRAEQWLDNYRGVQAARFKALEAASPEPPTQVTLYDSRVKLKRRSGILLSAENPRYPYAAFLAGYTQLRKPNPRRVQWLFSRMRADGLDPDINMYNMVIPALVRWGWTRPAFNMFRSLLKSETGTLPDAYTFRHLFVALNPQRRRHGYELPPPDDLSARQLCYDMVNLDRLRLHPRKPQPHRNIISAATFNCALGTYIAQGDYAAAWTIMALFTRYHISPDAKTSRIIILTLLRRMRSEMHKGLDEVMWMDRFLGHRRSMELDTTSKMLLVDRLYLIGHMALTEMKERRQQTYVKASNILKGSARDELNFLVALVRAALLASLGFTRGSPQFAHADEAISAAMYHARDEMIPRGRTSRN